jgi:multiple sugar transport system substrate-binding protein
MTNERLWTPHSRRHFLHSMSLAAVGASAASRGIWRPGTTEPPGGEPEEVFSEPASALSGSLSILLWSHFVPSHDEWFAPFAQRWGEQVGVDVTVDHINNTEIPTRIASEIQAGSGHDLIQYIATLSQFEPSVLPLNDVTEEAASRWGEQLELCRVSSFNPTTGNFYAYSPGWVPDPGDYRKSLWEAVGLPDGPRTWDDLLAGGTEIMQTAGVQLGIGLSPEIDSNMAGSALMWSFGASVQDENENVVINSPETVAAVEYMTQLFDGAMTDEVFAWTPASNNQGLVSGQLSFILNSISAWRTAQSEVPDVADDIFFVPALEGPAAAMAAQHVLYNWIVPTHAENPDAAKEFLLHYTANHPSATYHSKLYDFPAFASVVPELDGWLGNDPFGAAPPDKLAFLGDATSWSTNIGYPGPANTAAGEIFNTFVVSNMFARAARGEQTAAESVAEAEAECERIFQKWRDEGLVGGG